MAWRVPREWEGKRCFILGGGPSIKGQTALIRHLPNPIIAVNQAVKLRPDAEVVFWGDDTWREHYGGELLRKFTGKYQVSVRHPRGNAPQIKVLARSETVGHNQIRVLSHDPRRLGGRDSGSMALNLAYLFGATEIALLGFDMQGAHWHKDYRVEVAQAQYERFMMHLVPMADELEKRGVKVWNCSPVSALKCFPYQDLVTLVAGAP